MTTQSRGVVTATGKVIHLIADDARSRTHCSLASDRLYPVADEDARRLCKICEQDELAVESWRHYRDELMRAELRAVMDQIEAMGEVLEERMRQRRILDGLPADPPQRSTAEIRAEAAALRSANDELEAERIWEAG